MFDPFKDLMECTSCGCDNYFQGMEIRETKPERKAYSGLHTHRTERLLFHQLHSHDCLPLHCYVNMLLVARSSDASFCLECEEGQLDGAIFSPKIGGLHVRSDCLFSSLSQTHTPTQTHQVIKRDSWRMFRESLSESDMTCRDVYLVLQGKESIGNGQNGHRAERNVAVGNGTNGHRAERNIRENVQGTISAGSREPSPGRNADQARQNMPGGLSPNPMVGNKSNAATRGSWVKRMMHSEPAKGDSHGSTTGQSVNVCFPTR